MATLVPTPSVLVARIGRLIRASALASNMPAKPPRPPPPPGRVARRTDAFISSTALSPASTSTPAEAYVMGASLTRPSLPAPPPRAPPVPPPPVRCIRLSRVTVEHIDRERDESTPPGPRCAASTGLAFTIAQPPSVRQPQAMDRERLATARRLAQSQDGVVSRRQLYAAGLSEIHVRRAV